MHRGSRGSVACIRERVGGILLLCLSFGDAGAAAGVFVLGSDDMDIADRAWCGIAWSVIRSPGRGAVDALGHSYIFQHVSLQAVRT
jgi:hypothetical protein